MKIRTSTVILFMLLAATAVAEAPAPGEQSRQLTELMQADRLIVATVRNSLTRVPDQRLTAAQRECLSNVDLGFARDLYAQMLEATLSPEEMAAALEYYRSRPGHMNLMLSLRKHRSELGDYPGLAEALAAGDPGEEDARAILAFAKTPLGQKIGQMHTTPAGQRLVDSLVAGLMKQCALPS